MFSGGALNGPGFFSSIGLYASNSGGVGNSFSNASTNANAGAYFRARNNLNYDLLLSSKGSTEAKANTGVIDYSGPNGIELSTSDGGAGAGPIVLSPSGTEKLKADATGVKVTIGSDAARDMWFRDASTGYLKRIPYGTTGQVLTATTGSDPAWSNPGELTATFTTSDATPTTVVTIAPITGEVVTVEAVLDGIKSDGNSSVGGKKIRTFLRNASGTLSQSSETTTQAVNYLGGGLTTATFTITTSGSDIIIQFTGEASTTITGTVKYKINRSAAPL